MIAKPSSFTNHKALSVVQFVTADADSFSYTTATKGITDGTVEVLELTQSGSVNSLAILNHSDQFVFFADGDVLAGAKQNRVLNTSVFLAPDSKTVVPVSCVESGRWKYSSEKFRSTDDSAPSFLRASKARQVTDNARKGEGHLSDQSAIWASVDAYQHDLNVDSPTSSLSDIYDQKRESFEKFAAQFKFHETANGLALFTGKTLLHLDIFNRREVYREYFPKIMRGAALEAYGLSLKAPKLSMAEAFYKTSEFIDRMMDLESQKVDGVGVGEENRFESDAIAGFRLSYGMAMIHTAAFNLEAH